MLTATLNSKMLSRGWSSFSCDISPEARQVFEAACSELVGMSYKPVAVATQIVAGKDYSFFCNAKIVAPNTPNQAALINIYQPLNGEPYITEIRKLEPYVV